MCREYGVKDVLIAGIIPRRQWYTFNRCAELNKILIAQWNSDGIHLNDEGSEVLTQNYLFSLNSIAWAKTHCGSSS